MSERGKFHHPERARQLLSFDGLRWGEKTPTDLDLLVDFGGRGFVLVECKYKDTALPRGQELALERLQDAARRGGVPTLLLHASHSVDVGNVSVRDAVVIRFRYRRGWVPMRDPLSVWDIVDRFYRRVVQHEGAA